MSSESLRKEEKLGTMLDAVLRHLITLDDYRDLLAIYNEAKIQAGWARSDKGVSVEH